MSQPPASAEAEEEALQALLKVMDKSPMPVFVKDAQGRYLYGPRAFHVDDVQIAARKRIRQRVTILAGFATMRCFALSDARSNTS
jgi:hypothetical protein